MLLAVIETRAKPQWGQGCCQPLGRGDISFIPSCQEAEQWWGTTKLMPAKPDPSWLHPAPCKAPWPLLKSIYSRSSRSHPLPQPTLIKSYKRGEPAFCPSHMGYCPPGSARPHPCSALQPPGAEPLTALNGKVAEKQSQAKPSLWERMEL